MAHKLRRWGMIVSANRLFAFNSQAPLPSHSRAGSIAASCSPNRNRKNKNPSPENRRRRWRAIIHNTTINTQIVQGNKGVNIEIQRVLQTNLDSGSPWMLQILLLLLFLERDDREKRINELWKRNWSEAKKEGVMEMKMDRGRFSFHVAQSSPHLLCFWPLIFAENVSPF